MEKCKVEEQGDEEEEEEEEWDVLKQCFALLSTHSS